MNHRRPLSIFPGSGAGQKGRHTGTDILAQGNVNRRIGGDNAVDGQGLQDTHRRGRTLQQGRHQKAYQSAQYGISAQRRKGFRKNRGVRIGRNGRRH